MSNVLQEVKSAITQCNQVLGNLSSEEFNTLFSPEEIEFLRRLKRLSEVQDSVINTVEVKIKCLHSANKA